MLALASCTTYPLANPGSTEQWAYSGEDSEKGVSVALSTKGTTVITGPGIGSLTTYANGDFVEFIKGRRVHGHFDRATRAWWMYDRFGQFRQGIGIPSLNEACLI
jgi:hypothetical protein